MRLRKRIVFVTMIVTVAGLLSAATASARTSVSPLVVEPEVQTDADGDSWIRLHVTYDIDRILKEHEGGTATLETYVGFAKGVASADRANGSRLPWSTFESN